MITWPGIDKDRAAAAVWHLERTVQILVTAERLIDGYPWRTNRRALMTAVSEHMRMARGYLGAIGFEHGARV